MDVKKGASAFKNDPLKHIDLHQAVFSGRTVVGNHSAVTGAAPAPHRKEQYSAAYRPPMPSPSAPPTADREACSPARAVHAEPHKGGRCR
ncbi:hypothetical protein OsJ_21041 [Oryza sativa Japonica Group]|uniref:Uncharacterized protein n=1 Tax=Oryza sativa subsp. japonica TaxID=39947 RepID=A3BAW6_ORYSJ|nr:hypothetical protein OsJ_21041 [Oryza sativa Japonica Group]